MSPAEPFLKRTIAFIDGQNLYHSVLESFGYTYPNYDVLALSPSICASKNWEFTQARFYTGVPDESDDPFWNHFWISKLRVLSWQKIHIYSRPLRYRNRVVGLPDGTEYSFLAGEEKGIDVRMAIDIIRMAHRNEYDVALLLSQDQDLSEVASEIRTIAHEQKRWIKVACAFPLSPTTRNRRGIEKTEWVPINRATYDSCIDRRDYRLKGSQKDEEQQ
jgi:uncharacterized LabA/DUF88 family protein